MANSDYRLLTFRNGGTARAGALIDGKVYDCSSLLEGKKGIDKSSVRGILNDWDEAHAALKEAAAAGPDGGLALADVELDAPILYPRAIYCAGANYWDHFDEMADYMEKQGNPRPERVKADDPFFFLKATENCVVGPEAKVRCPDHVKRMDWEAELAIVIGKEGRDLTPANCMDIVAGCTILNDLSARDYVLRHNSAFKFDWVPHKCFDGAGPMGPWVTPLEFSGDPQKLWIKTWVNDEIKQDSNAELMVHNIAEQLVYLTRHITLRPGDVVATGTPAGVGYPQEQALGAGDVVRIEIENCGSLVTHIV